MLPDMTGCGRLAAQEARAMRHDPAGAAIVIMRRSLKLPGMAQAPLGAVVGDLLEQGVPAFDAAIPVLSQLQAFIWIRKGPLLRRITENMVV